MCADVLNTVSPLAAELHGHQISLAPPTTNGPLRATEEVGYLSRPQGLKLRFERREILTGSIAVRHRL